MSVMLKRTAGSARIGCRVAFWCSASLWNYWPGWLNEPENSAADGVQSVAYLSANSSHLLSRLFGSHDSPQYSKKRASSNCPTLSSMMDSMSRMAREM